MAESTPPLPPKDAEVPSSNTAPNPQSSPVTLSRSRQSSTDPADSVSRQTSPSLFVPLENNGEVGIDDMDQAAEEDEKRIKSESPTPPRKSHQEYRTSSVGKSPITNTDRTEDDNVEKAVIDLLSEDEELPDIAQIIDRPRIKGGSQTPKSQGQEVEMINDILPNIEDNGSPDHVKDSGEVPDIEGEDTAYGTSQEDQQRNPKERESQGKRARTAREWHNRRQAKLSPSRIKGLAYKEKQIAKIRNEIRNKTKKDISKRRKIKLSKRRIEARIDPRMFLDGGSKGHSSVSPDRDGLDQAGQPVVESSSKKDWWANFLEKNHDVDLHQCRGDHNDLLKKTKSFGYNKMKPAAHGKWELVGMESTLHNHQVLGLHHIVERECSKEGPWGSICADDMGMGKTVETIATIIANPPTPEQAKKNEKTTLIIVPSSLRSQWLEEIKYHAPSLGQNVMLFKSALEDNSLTRMKSNDVVVATYWELCQSYPSPSKTIVAEWEEKKLDLFDQYQSWSKNHQDENGLLHQIEWYRVVLDEGHFIKNHLSRTSRAAVALKGKKRLLLSGTPIMNSYTEFYPLFRFLREPLTANLSPRQFEEQYGIAQEEECQQCLSVILSGLIIRRTMNDKLFDQKIVVLPKDFRSIHKFGTLPSEEILNLAICIRLGELRHMMISNKDERTKLQKGYAQLTRMRQLSANPDIIAQQIVALLEISELKKLQNKVKEMKLPGRPEAFPNMLYHRLGLWIKDKKSGTYNAASEDSVSQEVCSMCKETSEDLHFLKSCKHKFCEPCLEEGIMRDIQEDDEEVYLCPTCTKPYKESQIRPCGIPKATGKASSGSAKSNANFTQSPRIGQDARDFRPAPATNQFCFMKWLERLDARKIDILLSAKLVRVRDQVLEWTQEAPQDKIIVFTQFRHLQVMIGCLLEKEKLEFLYFSGDMSSKLRGKAIAQFKADPKITVMIAGLKCGGLGLNLSFANRVIVTDIWWNVCIDNQAFGRVYRIGQNKESHYVKMVNQDTVESDILKLQTRKGKEINRAMQDDIVENYYNSIVEERCGRTVDEMIDRFGKEPNHGHSDAEMVDATDQQ